MPFEFPACLVVSGISHDQLVPESVKTPPLAENAVFYRENMIQFSGFPSRHVESLGGTLPLPGKGIGKRNAHFPAKLNRVAD